MVKDAVEEFRFNFMVMFLGVDGMSSVVSMGFLAVAQGFRKKKPPSQRETNSRATEVPLPGPRRFHPRSAGGQQD